MLGEPARIREDSRELSVKRRDPGDQMLKSRMIRGARKNRHDVCRK